jgi:hypothetical protein
VNWTRTDLPYVAWQGISCDNTGQYVTVVAFEGQVYCSEDYGVSWLPQNITVYPLADDVTSSTSTNSDSSTTLTNGTIAGIVIGTIIGAVIIGGLIAFFFFGVGHSWLKVVGSGGSGDSSSTASPLNSHLLKSSSVV